MFVESFFTATRKWFQCNFSGLNYVPIGKKTIVEGFMRKINIVELIGIDILIELSQWCVELEEIITFIANMVGFDLQYLIIVVWCTLYITDRVKGASTPLLISIITIIKYWYFCVVVSSHPSPPRQSTHYSLLRFRFRVHAHILIRKGL